MKKLPKDFANKWIELLRSGKYKQGKHYYYNKETDCYCGLGLSILAIGGTYNGIFVDLPEGISWPLVHNDTISIKQQIIELNDDLGYTFNQQADWL